jgi:hypothetical protein
MWLLIAWMDPGWRFGGENQPQWNWYMWSCMEQGA